MRAGNGEPAERVRRAWEATPVLAWLKAIAVGSTPLCGARALPPGSARAVLGWLRDDRRGVCLLGHSRLHDAFEDEEAATQRQ